MSHLRPQNAVTISPGSAALPGSRRAADDDWGPVGEPLPESDWDTRVREFAEAVGVEDLDFFATRLDQTVEAWAHLTSNDIDVARTHLVGALAGTYEMATDGTDLSLDDDLVLELLGRWEITDPTDGDLIAARLVVLHTQLVAETTIDTEPEPAEGEGNEEEVTASPDEAGEVPDAPPVTGTDPAPGDPVTGTLEYELGAVPDKAADAVDWIKAGEDDADTQARARAALEVEQDRTEQRTTVLAAIEAVLGDGG